MKTDSTTRRQRQILLFAVGVILLSEPVLSMFRVDGTVAGLPILFVALFSIWALLIGSTAWMMTRPAPPDLLRARTPARASSGDASSTGDTSVEGPSADDRSA